MKLVKLLILIAVTIISVGCATRPSDQQLTQAYDTGGKSRLELISEYRDQYMGECVAYKGGGFTKAFMVGDGCQWRVGEISSDYIVFQSLSERFTDKIFQYSLEPSFHQGINYYEIKSGSGRLRTELVCYGSKEEALQIFAMVMKLHLAE